MALSMLDLSNSASSRKQSNTHLIMHFLCSCPFRFSGGIKNIAEILLSGLFFALVSQEPPTG
eukprot:12399646-Karenia_brevis.AAC.1